jgi:kumamolisin
VYFAPNTDQGFVDAITTAVHDTTNNPSVISISWGAAEAQWTEQAMDAMDAAFADAALLGVTVCCAAGDHGSADGMNDGRAYADFPSASVHVLGCGGTHLEADDARIALENVWNSGDGWATGGGVSEHFALPTWQEAANVPPSVNPGGSVGRGVPDVAGNADSSTGYRIHLNGQDAVFGGTSAVAPLWAALTAILNERLGGRVGMLNPVLYTSPAATQGFQDIVEGKNEVGTTPGYEAVVGWDACTGLGSPNGEGLLGALTP